MILARRNFRAPARLVGVAVAFAIAVGCDDGTTVTPDPFQPVGSWNATTFTATIDGTFHDLLALGGAITMTLGADNRLGGTYVFPDVGDVLGDIVDLTGDWQFVPESRSALTFEHLGESYVEALVFFGGGNQMVAEGVVDGVQVRIIMRRV